MQIDSSFDTMTTTHLHEPFLRRAAEAESAAGGGGGTSLGGFLTMRLVDGFAGDQLQVAPEGVAYQLRATCDYLDELHPAGPEVQHLREIGRVAHAALEQRAPWLLLPPLLAFAYWLEQELRLDEALDVLETTLPVADGSSHREEIISGYLQLGRVLRLKGRLEQARDAYGVAGEMATRLGDRHSELLSRIGQALVLQKTGNLPESERAFRSIMRDAEATNDRDALARSCHDLAVTVNYMGRRGEAVCLAFRAFQLYAHPVQRARAMSDTGMFLKDLGHYSAARDAFDVALRSDPPSEVRFRALVELLELNGHVRDRLSFERVRRELAANFPRLPVDEQVEYKLKLGIAMAAFDYAGDAEMVIRESIAMAEQHRLGELLFRAEDALADLREHRAIVSDRTVPARQEESALPELEETIKSLELLRASA